MLKTGLGLRTTIVVNIALVMFITMLLIVWVGRPCKLGHAICYGVDSVSQTRISGLVTVPCLRA